MTPENQVLLDELKQICDESSVLSDELEPLMKSDLTKPDNYKRFIELSRKLKKINKVFFRNVNSIIRLSQEEDRMSPKN